MLLNALVGILATQHLFSGVFGGQIPSVNGVIGGVPSDPSEPSAIADSSSREAMASSQRTPGKLRIKENSGICETTPGVYQAAGYGDLTPDKSLWYRVT